MTTLAAFTALKTICQNRHSVRSFSDQPLTDEQITAIRELARTAPYASGKKNWELVVVADRAVIRELAGLVQNRSDELGEQVRGDFRDMFLEYAGHFASFASAPALFIPVYKVQRSLSLMLAAADDKLLQWERDNQVKSIAGVIMLVQLAATSLGLGSCCMTGPLLAEAEIARLIGMKPGFEIGAMIPVGQPKEKTEFMETQLKEILARVFNLETLDTIKESDSLIVDLGADSLDFVEIIHLIERTFGVMIKTDEIMLGNSGLTMDELFVDGRLTADGATRLQVAFPAKQELFSAEMTKVAMFSLLTVADLGAIVSSKLKVGAAHA